MVSKMRREKVSLAMTNKYLHIYLSTPGLDGTADQINE